MSPAMIARYLHSPPATKTTSTGASRLRSPTLTGEFIRSVNYTDMHIGWVFARPVRNNAAMHIVTTCTAFMTVVPFVSRDRARLRRWL